VSEPMRRVEQACACQRPRLRVCRWSDRGLVAMFKFHSPFDARCSGERRSKPNE
jgi:hypothetical protein